MRGAGYGLMAIGVIVVILGLVNHYVLRMNPVQHTSTVVVVVGAILAVIGLVLTFLAGRSAAS